MRLITITITIIFVMIGCKSKTFIKPIKYQKEGIWYSCDALMQDTVIQKIICFSVNRDTILVENFHGSPSSSEIRIWYENGVIKEEGQYNNFAKVGVWKEYYPNEDIKSYKYYKSNEDSFHLFYAKLYSKEGQLDSFMLPLRFRTNSEPPFQVGQPYQLFVDLKYSEFDSLHSFGFIDESPSSAVSSDTVYYDGASLYIEFTPQDTGRHFITGEFYEVDGSKGDVEDENECHKKFKFEYEAIKIRE